MKRKNVLCSSQSLWSTIVCWSSGGFKFSLELSNFIPAQTKPQQPHRMGVVCPRLSVRDNENDETSTRQTRTRTWLELSFFPVDSLVWGSTHHWHGLMFVSLTEEVKGKIFILIRWMPLTFCREYFQYVWPSPASAHLHSFLSHKIKIPGPH